MKVLVYAPNYLPATRYGGPIRSSHGLAQALTVMGHEVHVFTTNVDGPGVLDVPIDQVVDIAGVKVRYYPIATPKRFYFAPRMKVAIEREVESFDIAHVNGMFLWPGPMVARSARAKRIPYIVSPRGMLSPEMIAGKSTLAKKVWIRLMERRNLQGAAAIHATSEEEADGIRRLSLELAPLKIVGNGVDMPAHPARADRIAKVWRGVAPGQRVAFLGRLDWTKGVDIAIAATLAQPSAAIVVAGHDQLGLASNLVGGLSAEQVRRVTFAGEVLGEDKWALLEGADILLAPSIKESFGIAVAEALAVGTPVICSEGVGASTIIRALDGACVVARSVDAFSKALAEMLADPVRRAAFGRGARQTMARDYTWDAIARKMEAMYQVAAADARRTRVAM